MGSILSTKEPSEKAGTIHDVTGRQAKLVSRLQRWLPEAVFEKGVRREFGLD